MQRMRRIALALSLPIVIAIGLVATASANGGPAGKTDVCHFASHKYVEISISTNALPAHMRHGDVMPDAYGSCP